MNKSQLLILLILAMPYAMLHASFLKVPKMVVTSHLLRNIHNNKKIINIDNNIHNKIIPPTESNELSILAKYSRKFLGLDVIAANLTILCQSAATKQDLIDELNKKRPNE